MTSRPAGRRMTSRFSGSGRRHSEPLEAASICAKEGVSLPWDAVPCAEAASAGRHTIKAGSARILAVMFMVTMRVADPEMDSARSGGNGYQACPWPERLTRRQRPDIQHSTGGAAVGIAFGQNDPAVDHDGAVPVTPPAGQRRDALAGRRLIHVESAIWRIDEQQTVSLEWTRPSYAVAPHLVKHSALELPGGGTAVVRSEHPDLPAVLPYRRLSEEIGAAGGGNDLQLVAPVRRGAGDLLPVEQADPAILASLSEQVGIEQYG